MKTTLKDRLVSWMEEYAGKNEPRPVIFKLTQPWGGEAPPIVRYFLGCSAREIVDNLPKVGEYIWDYRSAAHEMVLGWELRPNRWDEHHYKHKMPDSWFSPAKALDTCYLTRQVLDRLYERLVKHASKIR